MGITENIAARSLANQINDLADESANECPHASRLRYWESIRDHAAGKLPKPVEPKPMSDLQACHFEANTVMPYGKHAGKKVIEVDLDYLIWLAESPDEFKAELRRYLKSDRIQRELRKEATDAD